MIKRRSLLVLGALATALPALRMTDAGAADSGLTAEEARAIAKEIDPGLAEGVYVQFRGPHYETPAEVRMAGVLGGSAGSPASVPSTAGTV